MAHVTEDSLGLSPPVSGSGASLQRHLTSLVARQLLLQVCDTERRLLVALFKLHLDAVLRVRALRC